MASLWTQRLRICFRAALALFAVILAACATIKSGDGAAMRATSIALLLDSEPFDDEALASLERMEENLYEACGLLNDVAIRRRDGGGVRWLADAKAARSVPGCELAASNAREALADASR
jgi:hypothetical protein